MSCWRCRVEAVELGSRWVGMVRWVGSCDKVSATSPASVWFPWQRLGMGHVMLGGLCCMALLGIADVCR